MSEQAHRGRIDAWDGDLAIRLPQELVDALELEEGDDVDLIPVAPRTFKIVKLSSALTAREQTP